MLHRIVYHAVFHVSQVLREARSRSVVFVFCYRLGSGIETNSFDYTGCVLDIIAINLLKKYCCMNAKRKCVLLTLQKYEQLHSCLPSS